MGKALNAGRPTHEKTAATESLVRKLVLIGLDSRRIAQVVGISLNTLKKHYKEILQDGKTHALANVAAALYKNALNGNTTAQIFYLKTQGGWRERDPDAGEFDRRVPDIKLVIQAMPGGEPDSDSEPPE